MHNVVREGYAQWRMIKRHDTEVAKTIMYMSEDKYLPPAAVAVARMDCAVATETSLLP